MHTPGPWFTSQPNGTIYIEARLRGSTLQEIAACGPTEDPEQREANARLIAAAPKLLAALSQLVRMYGDGVSGVVACDVMLLGKDFDQARAAICEAVGAE